MTRKASPKQEGGQKYARSNERPFVSNAGLASVRYIVGTTFILQYF